MYQVCDSEFLGVFDSRQTDCSVTSDDWRVRQETQSHVLDISVCYSDVIHALDYPYSTPMARNTPLETYRQI